MGKIFVKSYANRAQIDDEFCPLLFVTNSLFLSSSVFSFLSVSTKISAEQLLSNIIKKGIENYDINTNRTPVIFHTP